MPRLPLICCLIIAAGCAAPPQYPASLDASLAAMWPNPSLVPCQNAELVWENMADVVDDYFQIRREEPVRTLGDVITEGRLDTFPAMGSTLFEPWRHDSADPYEKLESTLQSIRRTAVVRVSPGERGYWVEVAVFKELEDLKQPAGSTAGSAIFDHDTTLNRIVNPVGEQAQSAGWIPRGRDPALEQRILMELMARFAAPVAY
jgi:hypothetical protein